MQKEHTRSILAIGFDKFQIVSSSTDNTILIWNLTDDPSSLTSNLLAHHLTPSADVLASVSQEPRSGSVQSWATDEKSQRGDHGSAMKGVASLPILLCLKLPQRMKDEAKSHILANPCRLWRRYRGTESAAKLCR